MPGSMVKMLDLLLWKDLVGVQDAGMPRSMRHCWFSVDLVGVQDAPEVHETKLLDLVLWKDLVGVQDAPGVHETKLLDLLLWKDLVGVQDAPGVYESKLLDLLLWKDLVGVQDAPGVHETLDLTHGADSSFAFGVLEELCLCEADAVFCTDTSSSLADPLEHKWLELSEQLWRELWTADVKV
ncbi:hypothetical protein J6590_036149 [Homalodisca vitripennis]|nr:hypothetical protein J6590_036149 [Homalodisca vitripennis]